ncbi:MAG: hypothetical protein K0S51_1433 [Bacillales bacterium]|jgi:uncharacterized protein YvpB|nr:hypothetical protein [Bacillales bacterium]
MKSKILIILCSWLFLNGRANAEEMQMQPEVKVNNTKENIIIEIENSAGHILLINDLNKGSEGKVIKKDYERIIRKNNGKSKINIDIVSIDGLTIYNKKFPVKDLIAPKIYYINKVDTHSRIVTGRTEPYTTLDIIYDKTRLKTMADSDGYFYALTNLIPENTRIEIAAMDIAGNINLIKDFKVKKAQTPKSKILNVKLIKQMPELPRGCEVTSLAMLINSAGVKANKMILAKEIEKDPTKYTKRNGKVYFGNPNRGFVGSMYTFSKPGLGVYHGPINKLAQKYLPNKAIDITGCTFNHIENYITLGSPVWVISTSSYNYVPKRFWHKWNTPTGEVTITYKEHSVLITGFDTEYIYINDPLYFRPNRKINKLNFIKGWEQLGKQAVTYL